MVTVATDAGPNVTAPVAAVVLALILVRYMLLFTSQSIVLSVAVPSAADSGMFSCPTRGIVNDSSDDTSAVVAAVPVGP